MHPITIRIEALMRAQDLSVLRLAEDSSIPRMTLTRRLAMPETFKVSELARIAGALGVSMDELIGAAA
jgi:transcriptional regulator with XRE-family HTH domain